MALVVQTSVAPAIAVHSSSRKISNGSSFFAGRVESSSRGSLFGLPIQAAWKQRTCARPARRKLRVVSLFGLGVPELAVIAGVAALVFGPKKLPDLGKSLGKTVKSFQQAANEFQAEITTRNETPEETLENQKKLDSLKQQEKEKEKETSEL